MGLYQRAHVLDPRLLTYIPGQNVPPTLRLSKKRPPATTKTEPLGILHPPSVRLLHAPTAILCSARRERKKDPEKRTPKRRLQQQLQRRGPHRRAETPPGRRAVGAPKALRSCCRSMSQRGDWALAVAREPVPDPARAEASSVDGPRLARVSATDGCCRIDLPQTQGAFAVVRRRGGESRRALTEHCALIRDQNCCKFRQVRWLWA